jgi:hypothetical protein
LRARTTSEDQRVAGRGAWQEKTGQELVKPTPTHTRTLYDLKYSPLMNQPINGYHTKRTYRFHGHFVVGTMVTGVWVKVGFVGMHTTDCRRTPSKSTRLLGPKGSTRFTFRARSFSLNNIQSQKRVLCKGSFKIRE